MGGLSISLKKEIRVRNKTNLKGILSSYARDDVKQDSDITFLVGYY
jgi:predicted nucleotidyltransferase